MRWLMRWTGKTKLFAAGYQSLFPDLDGGLQHEMER
jgi:hypothetical protein